MWYSDWQDGDETGIFGQRFSTVPADNDDCSTPTMITSTPFSDTQDTTTATSDPSDPFTQCAGGTGDNTVWYSFTPSVDEVVYVRAASSDYTPYVTVIEGGCGGLNIGCAPFGADTRAAFTFSASAGTTYRILVGDQNSGGGTVQFFLDIACQNTPDLSCGQAQKGVLVTQGASFSKAKIVAKFVQGPALTQNDLGNPLTSDGLPYYLCVYDDGPGLVGHFVVDRAGEQCAGKPCWKSIGKLPPDGKGYKYKDKDGEDFSINKLIVKGGDAGKSKGLVKGKGDDVIYQLFENGNNLEFASSATMTLHASGGGCMSVTMTNITKRDASSFKAKKP